MGKINKVQPALPHLAYMVNSRPPASHPLKRADAGTGSEVVPGVRSGGRMRPSNPIPLMFSPRGAR